MTPALDFSDLLRAGRRARGRSQLDLSLEAGISARHLSFLETGRSRPSRNMVLLLAAVLDVPLRERNRWLHAAGYAPAFRESALEGPELDQIQDRLAFVLERMNPYPTVLLDRHWNVLRQNEAALAVLPLFLAEPEAVAFPINLMRVLFQSSGARPFVQDWPDLAGAMIQRLHREATLAPGDEAVRRLLEDCLAEGEVPAAWRTPDPSRLLDPVVPVHLARGDVRLRLFTSITTLGTPFDVTLDDVRIETFFPVDDASDEVLRRLVTDATGPGAGLHPTENRNSALVRRG